MNPGIANVLNLPFVQVALPILIGFLMMNLSQNKRMDEMSRRFDDRFNDVSRRFDEVNKRFDGIEKRLDRIEAKIENHGDRLTRVEEKTALVRG